MRATIQLCTYNRAALLERVLEACFDQTVPEAAYEVVLVDDGSTDATSEVIELARERRTRHLAELACLAETLIEIELGLVARADALQ